MLDLVPRQQVKDEKDEIEPRVQYQVVVGLPFLRFSVVVYVSSFSPNRFQEFVELVKEDRRIDAVKHARKFLCNVTPEQMACVQQGMALLAFPKDTLIEPYCKLLSEDRWQQLIEEFRNENYRLFQLSTKSVFTVALQVQESFHDLSDDSVQTKLHLAFFPPKSYKYRGQFLVRLSTSSRLGSAA